MADTQPNHPTTTERHWPCDGAPANAQRLRSGETVADTAVEAGIAQAILFRWKRQALIDAGVIEGAPSVEVDEKVA